jgi:predicted Fe-S protein YdhL (DUF1289 family)
MFFARLNCKLIIVNVQGYENLIITILLHYIGHMTPPSSFQVVAPTSAGRHGRAMNAPPRPIATPCVKVCVVDGESGLCLGCYRTLAEVAAWSRLSEAEREAIMADLSRRPSRVSPAKRALFGL